MRNVQAFLKKASDSVVYTVLQKKNLRRLPFSNLSFIPNNMLILLQRCCIASLVFKDGVQEPISKKAR